MYIVLMAMKKQRDYSETSFLKAMRETVVPVTMVRNVFRSVDFTLMMGKDCLLTRFLNMCLCFSDESG